MNRLTKEIFKAFHNTQTQAILEPEQVPKSSWKTMDGKGANTFPFHNLPPILKNYKKGLFCSFHPFLCWIKEKSIATLSYRDICEQKTQTNINSQFCNRITELANLLGT